jgi:hypothetical protein
MSKIYFKEWLVMKKIFIEKNLTSDSVLTTAREKMKLNDIVAWGADNWKKVRPCKSNDYTTMQHTKENANYEIILK